MLSIDAHKKSKSNSDSVANHHETAIENLYLIQQEIHFEITDENRLFYQLLMSRSLVSVANEHSESTVKANIAAMTESKDLLGLIAFGLLLYKGYQYELPANPAQQSSNTPGLTKPDFVVAMQIFDRINTIFEAMPCPEPDDSSKTLTELEDSNISPEEESTSSCTSQKDSDKEGNYQQQISELDVLIEALSNLARFKENQESPTEIDDTSLADIITSFSVVTNNYRSTRIPELSEIEYQSYCSPGINSDDETKQDILSKLAQKNKRIGDEESINTWRGSAFFYFELAKIYLFAVKALDDSDKRINQYREELKFYLMEAHREGHAYACGYLFAEGLVPGQGIDAYAIFNSVIKRTSHYLSDILNPEQQFYKCIHGYDDPCLDLMQRRASHCKKELLRNNIFVQLHFEQTYWRAWSKDINIDNNESYKINFCIFDSILDIFNQAAIVSDNAHIESAVWQEKIAKQLKRWSPAEDNVSKLKKQMLAMLTEPTDFITLIHQYRLFLTIKNQLPFEVSSYPDILADEKDEKVYRYGYALMQLDASTIQDKFELDTLLDFINIANNMSLFNQFDGESPHTISELSHCQAKMNSYVGTNSVSECSAEGRAQFLMGLIDKTMGQLSLCEVNMMNCFVGNAKYPQSLLIETLRGCVAKIIEKGDVPCPR